MEPAGKVIPGLLGRGHSKRKVIWFAVERTLSAERATGAGGKPVRFRYPQGFSPERHLEGMFGIVDRGELPTTVELLIKNKQTEVFLRSYRIPLRPPEGRRSRPSDEGPRDGRAAQLDSPVPAVARSREAPGVARRGWQAIHEGFDSIRPRALNLRSHATKGEVYWNRRAVLLHYRRSERAPSRWKRQTGRTLTSTPTWNPERL